MQTFITLHRYLQHHCMLGRSVFATLELLIPCKQKVQGSAFTCLVQTSAVASGKLTLADAQQRLKVTSIGKLQEFGTKLAKMIHQQDADSIARSLDLQKPVKESCFFGGCGHSRDL